MLCQRGSFVAADGDHSRACPIRRARRHADAFEGRHSWVARYDKPPEWRSGSCVVADATRALGAANVRGVSCTAGPACRSPSGAAVAAKELQSHDWRPATAVTPSRWRKK
jgi:hypothetical protein